MEHRHMMIGALLASSILAPTTAASRDAVIGLSPHQSPAALKAQAERVILHLAQTVEPGESAHIFDASKARIIATFAVANKQAYANPRAKLQANRAAIGKIKTFIDSARAVPGKQGQIDFPSLLRAVRQNYPAGDGADLIVIGSPVFDDGQAPSFSMRNGRVPNDGHIDTHLSRSLFGTKGLRGTLKGYDIYFADAGGNWSVSTQHSYHMERFWTVSVEGHNGSMAYFGDDLETLFGLAGKDHPDHQHAELLVPTDKLEMLQFAPDIGTAVDNVYSKPLAVEPAPEPIWRNASNVTIGITWDAQNVDLDLFVRPKPSAPVIYYENTSTMEGRLFKDFRASPRTGFETVSLNGQFDLSQTRLAVNFYGGRAPAGRVTGELRLAIGETVWAQPFTIARSKGNKGDGAETAIIDNTAPNDAWVIFDPLTVLGAQ